MVETVSFKEVKNICNLKSEILEESPKSVEAQITDCSHKEIITQLSKISEKDAFIETIENFINSKEDVEPFFIADMNSVINQHKKWINNLPRFTPFYAIKSNNDPMILNTLIRLGTSFDCASQEEIKTMLDMGVPPSKIIFANPCKAPLHIRYASENGVMRMTFDNDYELYKIKENHSKPQLVIRILVDDSNSICQFGTKFGVHPEQTKELLELAKKLELEVVGVSFHVGSGCMDPKAFSDAIKRAKDVFDEAKEIGFNFNLLDIGGGFPGLGAQNGFHIEFEDIAKHINEAVELYFPQSEIEMIAEPGRFYSSRAFTLVANITSKRTVIKINESNNKKVNMYYINDGVYGSFNSLIFDHAVISYPTFVIKDPSNGVFTFRKIENINSDMYESSIWGPTCDSMDCLTKSIQLPDLSIGDWLIFENMGAYTLVASSRFNGMNNPKVYYLDSNFYPSTLSPDYSSFFFTNKRAIISEGFS